jgi:hypothetical protein
MHRWPVLSLSDGAARSLVWFCSLVLAVLAVLAPLNHLYAYADSSAFSVAILTGRAWDLIWVNYSGRLTTYLLTVLPAELLVRLGAGPRAALAAYSTIFWGLPLASLALSWLILPRDRRFNLVFPALSTVAFGLLVYGFPSETWVTMALFWPTLFAIRYLEGAARPFAVVLLLGLFFFTHELMVTALPIFLIAAARRSRRAFAFVLTAIVACAALYVAAKLALPPDAATAKALNKNAASLLSPTGLVVGTLLCAPLFTGLLGAGAFSLAYALMRRAGAPRSAAAVMAALAGTAAALGARTLPAIWAGPYAEGRYHARVAAVGLTVLAGASPRSPTSGRPTPRWGARRPCGSPGRCCWA